jgi:hypothetical protein
MTSAAMTIMKLMSSGGGNSQSSNNSGGLAGMIPQNLISKLF